MEVLTAEIISPLELLHSDEWLAVPRSATAQPHGWDYSGVTDWSGFQMNPSAILQNSQVLDKFSRLCAFYLYNFVSQRSMKSIIPIDLKKQVNGCLFLPANSTPDYNSLTPCGFLTQTCLPIWQKQISNPMSEDRFTQRAKEAKEPAKPLKAHRIGPKKLEKKDGMEWMLVVVVSLKNLSPLKFLKWKAEKLKWNLEHVFLMFFPISCRMPTLKIAHKTVVDKHPCCLRKWNLPERPSRHCAWASDPVLLWPFIGPVPMKPGLRWSWRAAIRSN